MKLLKKIFKLTNKIRIAIINFIFWLFVIILIASLSVGSKGISTGGTLVIKPSGNIIEAPEEADLLTLLNSSDDAFSQNTQFRDIIDSINIAKDDNHINEIVLDLDYLKYAGFAVIEEIGTALKSFRESGKKVYTFSSSYSQAHYYLGSFTDEIVMDPIGEVSLDGLGIYRSYWKETLDKFDVDVQIFRAGDFKSYVEPYMSTSMSPGVKKQNLLWMESIWGNFIKDISINRSLNNDILYKLTQDKLTLLKEYRGNSSSLALSNGLVDSLKTRGEFYKSFDDQYNFQDYIIAKRVMSSGEKVAVVTLEGAITYSNSNPGYISAIEVADTLDSVIADDDVKALIVRINSGGGGVYASELIRRKLEDVKKLMPVVVSMGDVCASGGYWIATSADHLIADKGTITGSIGVFGIAFGLEKTLENSLGVYNDGVATTPYAGQNGFTKNLSEEIVEIYQLSVDDFYNRFLSLVENSRGIPRNKLERIAGGRVWSGEQAEKFNLVDVNGGYAEARTYLQAELGSDQLEFVYFDGEVPILGQVMDTLFKNVKIPESFLSKLIDTSVVKDLDLFTQIDDPRNVYALWY